MPSLRDLRRQIKSVQNTQKITKAMQVISATRLRRAQSTVLATRPYSEKMLEVLAATAERAREYRHPFLQVRDGRRAAVILITSDRGLAGALNMNTIRAVTKVMADKYPDRQRYVTIGRKGRDLMYRYGREVIAEVSGLPDRAPIADILPSVTVALEEYLRGEVDVILLAHARWVSTLRQEATVRTLVPVEIPVPQASAAPTADFIYEPDAEEVLDLLLPRYVETQVYAALLENQASEHSARMIAMQNATDAAGDLISNYTLIANKVRQASITAELMEIIGGASAQAG
jgi:F-type H+-transporting ATPase subunit gamma